MAEATEEELIKIINSKKCKSVRINGKNYYISKKVKDAAVKKHSEGGFAFLAAIPWAIGALAGSATVASGVASAVASSRDAIKKKKETELVEIQTQIKKKKLNALEANEAKTIKAEGDDKQSAQTGPETYKGTGIFLNPYQGSAIHKYLKNIDPKFKKLTKKFKKGTHIIKHGNGIYLNPYSAGKAIDYETEDETETETETEDEQY